MRSVSIPTPTWPLPVVPLRLHSQQVPLRLAFLARSSFRLLRPSPLLLPSPAALEFPLQLLRPLQFQARLLPAHPPLRLLRHLLRLSPRFLRPLCLPRSRPPLYRSHKSGSRTGRFCPPSFRRFPEFPSIAPASSKQASPRN